MHRMASERQGFCSQRFISSSDCAVTLKVKVLPARKIKKIFFIYRISNFRSYLWQRTYPKIRVLKAMAHDLRANLDQFQPQRRQCPATHRLRQHRLAQKVTRIAGQHEQLQPYLVVHKVVTGQAHPSSVACSCPCANRSTDPPPDRSDPAPHRIPGKPATQRQT
jgi:hypothetical protein